MLVLNVSSRIGKIALLEFARNAEHGHVVMRAEKPCLARNHLLYLTRFICTISIHYICITETYPLF